MKRHITLLFGLLLISASGHARVLSQAEGGFVLENKIETQANSQDSWHALVNDVGLWWPAAHSWFGKAENFSINPVAGGCFCERDGPQQVQHMLIVHANPGVLLRMMGGLGPLQGMGLSGPLDWIFEPLENGGTRIRLRYHVSGFSPKPLDDFIVVVDKVQGQQLQDLGDFLQSQDNH